MAVAGGAYIFVYKHLKGTFKFLIPNVDPNTEELQIWTDLKEAKLEAKDAINKLIELKTNCKIIFFFITYKLLRILQQQYFFKFKGYKN